MAIDTASYVGGLNKAIPANQDKRLEGAGQIRAVKNALVNSFPNVEGEVKLTHNQLNAMYSTGTEPNLAILGEVRWFYNSLTVIQPLLANWRICNGQDGTPNLLEKFIRAADKHGQTGGSDTSTVDFSTVTIAGAVLGLQHLPKVTSQFWGSFDNGENSGGSAYLTGGDSGGRDGRNYTKVTVDGGEQPHTHGTSGTATVATVPAYITLVPMMYVGSDGGSITPPPPAQIPLDISLQPIDQTLKYSDEPYTVSAAWNVPEEFQQHSSGVEYVLEEQAEDGTWTEITRGDGTNLGGITHVVNPVTGEVTRKED